MQIKARIVSHTADSKPVKQGVNGTVILPLLVYPTYLVPTSARKKRMFPHVDARTKAIPIFKREI